jgi:phytoene dehydrogenase-like protein
MSYDAVIIGAGHNGLVTACYLARAGMKVCVVEKNDWVGGAAVSRSLYPGFTYSNCSYVSSLFRPEIMRDLELPKHGLQILPYEGGAVFQQGGGYLGMFRDHDANRREFARHSPRDAESYERYSRDHAPLSVHPPAVDAHAAGPEQLSPARSVGTRVSWAQDV